jgi:hypothetical protein
MNTVLEVARPECAAEVLADEVVALNVESGIYFSLRELAAGLWNDLAAGHPVETLAECAREHGGSDEAVTDFAAQLTRYGLMRAGTAQPAADEPTTRDLLRAGTHEIVFEVFEDMQDLILSDPIHDVDESKGWPHRAGERA